MLRECANLQVLPSEDVYVQVRVCVRQNATCHCPLSSTTEARVPLAISMLVCVLTRADGTLKDMVCERLYVRVCVCVCVCVFAGGGRAEAVLSSAPWVGDRDRGGPPCGTIQESCV